ncbi:hypothetical protein BC828DRAFT_151016 [Blastocladiella britannica]|nr:hypothetical protein BC828DRAFT_151016 [Blastocladiella britannica]
MLLALRSASRRVAWCWRTSRHSIWPRRSLPLLPRNRLSRSRPHQHGPNRLVQRRPVRGIRVGGIRVLRRRCDRERGIEFGRPIGLMPASSRRHAQQPGDGGQHCGGCQHHSDRGGSSGAREKALCRVPDCGQDTRGVVGNPPERIRSGCRCAGSKYQAGDVG